MVLKKEQKSRFRRLGLVSAAATGAVAVLGVQSADAAIVYGSLNQTFSFETNPQNINFDLNGDSIDDINVDSQNTFIFGSDFFMNVDGLNGTNIGAVVLNKSVFVTRFEANSTIDSFDANSGARLFDTFSPETFWKYPTPNDGFIAIALNIGGQTHNGWMRFTATSATSGTLVDFAYQEQPNTAILAGEGAPASVPESSNLLSILLFGAGISAAGGLRFLRNQKP